MRIAIFTDTYKPEINGVVTSVELFRRELERRGHTVYLVCPDYPHQDESQPNVFRFPSTPYLFKMMTERRFAYPSIKVFRQIFKLDIDIIHSQVPANIGAFGLFVGRFRHIPNVTTYHTLFAEYTHYMPIPTGIARYLVELISRRFTGRCQRVISPSYTIKQELRKYHVDAPIDVIPTGMDFHDPDALEEEPVIRRRLGIPEGKRVLSMIGRIGREKNISFLLKVMKLLKQRRSDFVFVVTGDGPDLEPLQTEVAELGLEQEVVFTGYVTRPEVFGLLKLTTVLVFASLTETQGLVLLESMSMGTPIVAIEAMGVSDLISEGKGGIPARMEKEDFADKVERLLDDEHLYETKRQEALEKAREWSIERMTDRLLESYSLAISDYHRSRRQPRFGERRGERFRELPDNS
ncbi:MAG: glycosyltransferase [Spirochaetota bacterium]